MRPQPLSFHPLSLSYSQLSALLPSPLNSHILNSLCPYDLQQDSHEPALPQSFSSGAQGNPNISYHTLGAPRLSRGPQKIVPTLQDLGSLGVTNGGLGASHPTGS